MATLVCFHAHPDDEAIGTGGVMAKAADQGHRVVLVTATRGENGEVDEGFLDPGEALGDRRQRETVAAAKILGAARCEFLGYRDSGMMGTPENDDPESFWQADVEEAARRLASILDDEHADVMTIYDQNGVYGHPDHIKVWQVGVEAAKLVGVRKVYELSVNRTEWLRIAAETDTPIRTVKSVDGVHTLVDLDPGQVRTIEFPIGVDEDQLTTRVDVRDYVDVKRAAMRAHESQINDQSFFFKMPEEAFVAEFGTEWFILRGAPAGVHEDDLFTGL